MGLVDCQSFRLGVLELSQEAIRELGCLTKDVDLIRVEIQPLTRGVAADVADFKC